MSEKRAADGDVASDAKRPTTDGGERRPFVVIDKRFPQFMMDWLEERAEVIVMLGQFSDK